MAPSHVQEGPLDLEEERYLWVTELGRGGMGSVHLAFDRWLGKSIALKQLSQRKHQQLFLREVLMATQLSHPNIVSSFDLHYMTLETNRGIEPKSLFLSMEFVQGCDLDAYLKQRPHLPLSEIRHITQGICEGLAYAHSKGVVHRDLKPSNIFCQLDQQDNFQNVLLADFGLAKPIEEGHEVTISPTGLLGTPTYVPLDQIGWIEKAQQHPLTRLDIYALGVLLYRMIGQRHPYISPEEYHYVSNDPYEALRSIIIPKHNRICFGSPQPGDVPPSLCTLRPSLAPAINDIIMASLSPDPNLRPLSVADIATQLAAPWEQTIALSDEANAPQPTLPTGQRWLWFAYGMLTMFVLCGLVWWLARN
jgi:serine/threonine-protein kinase